MSDERAANHAMLPGDQAEALLGELATWSRTTTIILHGGCVFEFKGRFPRGEMGQGFYNLDSQGEGFEGHINLELISQIRFQDKTHRGKTSFAFVFENRNGECLFKVFLGRDEQGNLYPEQLARFTQIRDQSSL